MRAAIIVISCAALVTGSVAAIPSTRRLRRKESFLEIPREEILAREKESKQQQQFLGLNNEEDAAELIRLLQIPELFGGDSSMSMSMSMSMPPTDAPVVGTPAPTGAPVVGTLAPTGAPVVVETPAPTGGPVAAETPAPTGAPVVEDTPAPTDAPVVADTPVPSTVPTSTDAPVAADTPVPSTAPTSTDAPVAADTPVPSTAPTSTDAPVAADTPVPSTAPTSTDAPVEGTPAPTGSSAPSSTDAPVEGTPAPTGSSAPSSTDAPAEGTPAPTGSSTPTIMPGAPTTDAPTTEPLSRDLRIREKCGMSPLERSRDILSVLSVISEPVELVTPSSPYFMARNWIDNIDEAIICAASESRIDQRYRMALLYYRFGGQSWYNCRAKSDSDESDICLVEDVRDSRNLKQMLSDSNGDVEAIVKYRPTKRRGLQDDYHEEEEAIRWLDATNECAWYGLDCGEDYSPDRSDESVDAYYPVLTIDLSSNNLNGELIKEIFEFGQLEGFFLDGNMKITGTIPEALGEMPKLKFLDLDDNEIVGTLPNSLFTLYDLIAIDLNTNQLTGTLSESIGGITNLEVLQLENNNMSGPLPADSLLELRRLVALTVEGNLFTGTLEPLCEVRDERREEYEIYLQFMFAECAGDDPLVDCSCCVCY